MDELVSIITPTYNAAKYVEETINSILVQTYSNWELLITDDCSKDNTLDIIRNYVAKDSRIHLFVLGENSGAAVARNHSISKAKGRYIAFCDSDDRWRPDKLERQLKFMSDNNYDLTFTSYTLVDESGGKIVGVMKCPTSVNYKQLLRSNDIACLTAMYDTRNLGKVYMPLIRKRQDWGLWLKIVKQIGLAYGLQYDLAIYRQGGGISSNKIEMLKYNYALYHDVEHFSKLKSFELLYFHFIPYYFIKRIKIKFGK